MNLQVSGLCVRVLKYSFYIALLYLKKFVNNHRYLIQFQIYRKLSLPKSFQSIQIRKLLCKSCIFVLSTSYSQRLHVFITYLNTIVLVQIRSARSSRTLYCNCIFCNRLIAWSTVQCCRWYSVVHVDLGYLKKLPQAWLPNWYIYNCQYYFTLRILVSNSMPE